jgi:hypothetical protein
MCGMCEGGGGCCVVCCVCLLTLLECCEVERIYMTLLGTVFIESNAIALQGELCMAAGYCV